MAESALLRWFRPAKSSVGRRTSTPILDLVEPFPKPADEIITGKFASPFLTLVAIVVMDQNYSFLIVLLGFLPALILAVALHEFGHLIFGWCAGLRFRGVDVGPLCIRRTRTKWSLRLRPRIYIGAAYMQLRRVRRIKRQLVICTLGGPIASYVFALLAFLLGEIYLPTDTVGWTTFLEFSGFLSLLVALFSTFPYHTRMGGNDAYLLRRLVSSRNGSTQMIAAHAAAFAGNVEPIPPAYFERWWKLASVDSEGAYSRFYVGWKTYSAAKDPSVAAGQLEELLRQSFSQDPETRNFLAAEAAFFTARHRPSSGHSSVWLRRTRIEWLGSLSRIRLESALAESRQEFVQALAICESGLKLIRANLNGESSIKMESEWADWRKQIEDLANAEIPEILQPC